MSDETEKHVIASFVRGVPDALLAEVVREQLMWKVSGYEIVREAQSKMNALAAQWFEANKESLRAKVEEELNGKRDEIVAHLMAIVMHHIETLGNDGSY